MDHDACPTALISSNTYEQLRFHANFLATQGHTHKKGGRYKIEKCTLKILLARFSGEILRMPSRDIG